AASGYSSVVTELSGGPWVGPASASMLKAVTPYVSWLSVMAAMAEETASQGRAAAAAYEAAFAMTVPPPAIAANRVLLATLVATNFFGQNTPAIAATEADYGLMWAQDAVAMYGYAGASVLASALEPFPAPPNTTTPDATTDQAMAVSRAATEPAGNVAHAASNTGSQLGAVAPMQQLATTAAAADDPGPFTWLQNLIQDLIGFGLPTPNNNFLGLNPTLYNVIFKLTSGLAYFSNGIANFGWSIGQQLTFGPGGATVGAGGAWFPTPQFASLGLGNLGGVGHVGGGAAAAAGQAAG
ncbi:hypothetical protein A5714_21650, partial [Mycobacterium sp. E2462]|uniref:PPE family protein n=1 Tax=Mycobacterium sp. E2462 TaxID=1834133 RepID=UPI0007FBEB37